MDLIGDIRLFIKVANNGSFAGAAREIGLSPASVTVKINRLENHYGVKLFQRTTRQIKLTEEGDLFLTRCMVILEDLKEAEEQLTTGKSSMKGRINLTAPVDLGEQHLAPLVGQFCQQHPEIQINLHLSDGLSNLLDAQMDLAIRFGELADSQLISRKLANNQRILVASPEYLKKAGKPLHPSELKNHQCLTMIRKKQALVDWHFIASDSQEKNSIKIIPHMCTNLGSQIRKWAIAGHGIAMKSHIDVVNELEAGQLETVLDKHKLNFTLSKTAPNTDLHLIFPNREFLPHRVRALIDEITQYFAIFEKYS